MNYEIPAQSLCPPEIPLLTITPLYCLVTDADEIKLTTDTTVGRFSADLLAFLGEDDRFVQHLRLYTPQCLLWDRSIVPLEDFRLMAKEFADLGGGSTIDQGHDLVRSRVERAPTLGRFMTGLVDLLRGLQLYRRGRLVVGDSLFVFSVPLPVRLIVRCTDMQVDYQIIEQYRPLYELNSSETFNFLVFYRRFLELSLANLEYPEIQLAISLYCRETAQHGNVIGLITCLESLMGVKGEGIAFTLAQRIANLLGPNATSRKELFAKVKSFYGLRSKRVHGEELKPKEVKVEDQLDELRNIVRKAILSVMIIAAEYGMGQEFQTLLGDIALDDELRNSIQTKVSALLSA
jgi:hypothetical protein